MKLSKDILKWLEAKEENEVRKMVTAGLSWWKEHPEANPTFKGYKELPGFLIDTNNDARDLALAMTSVLKDPINVSSTMFSNALIIVYYTKAQLWTEYLKLSAEGAQ